MPDMTEPFLPKQIATMRDDLLEATGQTADIHRTSPLHYLLVLTNERIELTITWRRNHRGAWKWKNSTLTVDGTVREIARDFDDFVRIWNDPDILSRPNGRSEVPELTPVDDESQLPGPVRQALDSLRNSARRKDAEDSIHTLAAATDTGYTVQFTSPKGTLHLNFCASSGSSGTWALARRHAFRVYDGDGLECTNQFAGDLRAAMADLFGLGSAPAVPGQLGHTRQADVANSVQVRRHSVIRV